MTAFSMLQGWDQGFRIPSFGILVDVDCCGRGYGHRLTEWTLRWAWYKECMRVRLSVYLENRYAYKMYKNMGFIEKSRELGNNGLAKVLMEVFPTRPSVSVYVSTQCLAADEPLRDRLNKLYGAGLFHIELSNYPVDEFSDLPSWVAKFKGGLLCITFFP